MAERSFARTLGKRLVYMLLALLIVFSHLIPLDIAPKKWPGPDLLVALTFAWALRRPDIMSSLLIASTLFVADLLLSRPPGLWAVLVLLGAEWLKSHGQALRGNTFAAEFAAVSGAMALIYLGYRVVLGLLVASPGALYISVVEMIMTIASYPLVAGASYLIFGIRRTGPGEFEHTGRRL